VAGDVEVLVNNAALFPVAPMTEHDPVLLDDARITDPHLATGAVCAADAGRTAV
jgi:hypothetical protein